jgi:hypothetical protein
MSILAASTPGEAARFATHGRDIGASRRNGRGRGVLAQLTTAPSVGILANTASRLIQRERVRYYDGTFAEIVIWHLPEPVPGSVHHYKYRLFFGRSGNRIIGYDNERGKGDHRHQEGTEEPYVCISPARLRDDFLRDIAEWRARPRDDDRG